MYTVPVKDGNMINCWLQPPAPYSWVPYPSPSPDGRGMLEVTPPAGLWSALQSVTSRAANTLRRAWTAAGPAPATCAACSPPDKPAVASAPDTQPARHPASMPGAFPLASASIKASTDRQSLRAATLQRAVSACLLGHLHRHSA